MSSGLNLLLSPKRTFTLELLRNSQYPLNNPYVFKLPNLCTLPIACNALLLYLLSIKSRLKCLSGLFQAMFPQQSSLISIIEFIILF